tara:strand:- start:3501 stop:3737 length:237 start_codon:yes stop_codon:yes gene_type:complete
MDIKCIVGCIDSEGSPDFQLVTILDMTMDDYNNGIHYDTAKDIVENEGYESRSVCDEHDAGFGIVNGHALDWSTALTA